MFFVNIIKMNKNLDEIQRSSEFSNIWIVGKSSKPKFVFFWFQK